ncbi:hypothetical protein PV10_00050 [Exophiala mesophila]|uniref:Metallo-beta-lactamase domain-containing protein n=1 Tax=Exophiala mesophila TaxID=212818 RepID=A0A0D1ZNE1_EXOME|nr:uncharacterized protein PV10_00050 [Exophiala mesophila]KIV96147.1 hypothetical protein PV10_00050 [Exophiala mesophila]
MSEDIKTTQTPAKTTSFFSWTNPQSKSQSSKTYPPHHANNSANSFTNPWPSAQLPTWGEMLSRPFPFSLYKFHHHSQAKTHSIKVVQPDWGASILNRRQLEKSDCVIGTWLGHASALVEFPVEKTSPSGSENLSHAHARLSRNTYFLFDPIFSHRAGPTAYSGPSRINPPPCHISDLPGCDMVLISHNHYDHLDTASITAVLKKFPHAWYFVPLGIKAWLISTGVSPDRVTELDWWDDRDMIWSGATTSGLDASSTGKEAQDTPTLEVVADADAVASATTTTRFRISCVPAQHNSGRTPADQAGTLWCGWIIERFEHHADREQTQSAHAVGPKPRKTTVYHAGDTGYRALPHLAETCPAFQAIGSKFGPIDLSFIPIWRGGTLGFISALGLRLSHHDVPATLHASPADAVDIHCDVGSRWSLGIHFGTFVGAQVETWEAISEFQEKCTEKGVQWRQRDQEESGQDLEGESADKNSGKGLAATPGDSTRGTAGVVNIGESLVVELI